MNKRDLALAIYRTVNHLILVSADIHCRDDISEGEDSITIYTQEGKVDITIFNDGTIVVSPNQERTTDEVFPGIFQDPFEDIYDRHRLEIGHRPGNLPSRTCPRCRGKGKI